MCDKVVLVEPTLTKLLAARCLSRDSLKIPCPEKVCYDLASKLTEWRRLCPYIGLNEVEEEDINENYKRNAEKRIGMFRVWRQKYDAEATYLCLADAFESLKRRDQITILLEHFARQKEQCVESGKKSKTVPRLDDRPKPSEIIRVVGLSGEEIVIRDQLASHWEDLCVMLEFQPPSECGSMMEAIRRNCHYQVEDCCREVLLKWLSGSQCSSGSVTWRTLITVMRKISFDTLADQLEQELNS